MTIIINSATYIYAKIVVQLHFLITTHCWDFPFSNFFKWAH